MIVVLMCDVFIFPVGFILAHIVQEDGSSILHREGKSTVGKTCSPQDLHMRRFVTGKVVFTFQLLANIFLCSNDDMFFFV